MTKFLKGLLTNNEPLFSRSLQELERSTGHDSVDVRLIADITHSAHSVMRQLGLDTADTTARELYLALNSYVVRETSFEALFATDFVLINIDGQVVSFNLIDAVENSHHQLSFEDRLISHGQRALRGEIIARYLAHPRTSDSQTKQLAADAGLLRGEDTNYDPVKNKVTGDDTMNDNNQPHILCVGDIITDAFIKLSEDYAEETTDDKGYQRLTFELGAKLPYDGVDIVEAVECSPNAAVSLSRLGLSASLMSWVGDDDTGKGMAEYLKGQGVGTDDMIVESGIKSNYHYVLRYGADRTKLQRFEDYSYEWREPAQKPDWLYLGVLGEKTWPLHEAIMAYLQANPDIKLVFQPGMYHLMWGTEKMRQFYERAEIVIMNREEAAQVTGLDRGDITALIHGLHDLGVTVAVVTDGPEGAYASNGDKMLSMPNYPDPVPPYDRTGAGDAFASTIVAALALGESLETALTWAPINSMNVVQKLGAQAGLLRREDLKQYLDDAPDNYHTTEMQV